MRIISILIFLTSINSCSISQNMGYSIKNKKAIKFYESALTCFNTIDSKTGRPDLECAENFVIKALAKDSIFSEALSLASNIYIKKSDINTAIYYRKKMIRYTKQFSSIEYYYLAAMQMAIGDYKQVKLNAMKYIMSTNQNQDISRTNICNRFIENADFALESINNPSEFNPINLGPGVNTPRPEYFPSITADDSTLLFTRVVIDENSAWGGKQEDIFVSHKNTHWSHGELISTNINTKFNEGAPTFSADGKYIIFVGCETGSRGDYEYGVNRKGYGSCDLFVSENIGNYWTVPVNMGPPINTRHWETQPSFSSDGKTLYFIRGLTNNREKRNKDDQDIYKTEITENGEWSKPVKLSKNINTPYSESSVQIHPDGQTLYFSSNGHSGMGGLDIFMSRIDENGKWGKPTNLGYPINTFKDENSVLVSSKGDLAIFASNREGGYGSLDLYSFILPEKFKPIKTTFVKGKVYDIETKVALSAEFSLTDLSNGKVFKRAIANSGNGEFMVAVPENKDFALHAEYEGYLFFSENYSIDKLKKSESGFVIDVPMSKISKSNFILENIFFDVNSAKLKKESGAELNKLYEFLSKNPTLNVELGGHTDSDGNDNDNQILSEQRAEAVVTWLINKGISHDIINFKGYGESKPLVPDTSKENKAKNRRTELTIR